MPCRQGSGRPRRRRLLPRRKRRLLTAEPQRTCAGCRRVGPQREMVRVVRNEAGEVQLGRHAAGRGAWLCAVSPACWERAVARGGLARSFRAPVDRVSAEQLVAVLLDRAEPNVKD